MALGIQIISTGEFLQLYPDTVLELEDFNPFLQFTEEGIKGSFTMPFDIKATPHNNRNVGYASIHQKKLSGSGIDAILYDDANMQHGVGKIKIEKPTNDLNNVEDGKISCYFLAGASNFFQDIKDKKLRDINTGGDRSFEWDGLDSDAGVGFWRHIHQVANGAVNAYDYAFYPVLNADWPEYDDNYPPEMNRMFWDPTVYPAWPAGAVRFPTNYTELDDDPANRIVPFPYLHYIIKRFFATVGWNVKGDILTDETFRKITMLSFRAIDWARQGNGTASYYANDPVVFNLSDHLPDWTMSRFLIQLQNRFGFEWKFDRSTKTCTIRLMKNAATGTVKDFTRYCNPDIPKTVLQNVIKYSLITTDGISGGKLDLTAIDFKGLLDERTDLPAADETKAGFVYLIVGENNYYICDSDGDNYSWSILGANTFDYIPDGATEQIETEAGTVGMEQSPSVNYDLMPRLDNPGLWVGHGDQDAEWGLHLLFYHGLKGRAAPNDDDLYCYASNHIYDANMNQVADWGLTYTCFKTDGTDVGLYATFWKDILELLRSQEELEIVLYLPRHLYMQLDYTDQIVIAGVRMFVKTKNLRVPYENKIKLTCLRI
jgi:hypothetical protein